MVVCDLLQVLSRWPGPWAMIRLRWQAWRRTPRWVCAVSVLSSHSVRHRQHKLHHAVWTQNDASFSILLSSRPSSKRSKKQKTNRVNTTLFQVLESRWSRRGALPKSVPKEDLTWKQGWVCGWLSVPWSMAEPAVVIAGGTERGGGLYGARCDSCLPSWSLCQKQGLKTSFSYHD